jgi:hypothetical protein
MSAAIPPLPLYAIIGLCALELEVVIHSHGRFEDKDTRLSIHHDAHQLNSEF